MAAKEVCSCFVLPTAHGRYDAMPAFATWLFLATFRQLDPAFLRRFQKRVHVGLPDLETRKQLLRIKVCWLEEVAGK